jgi:hypothetical protein
MGSLTDAWEVLIMEHALGLQSVPVPTTLCIALFTGNPGGDPGTFSFANEVSGNGYARAECAPGGARWTVSPASRSATNDDDITFQTPTGGDWGTIVYFALCNSLNQTLPSTPIFVGQIAGGSVFIGEDSVFFVQAGGLDITIPSGFYSDNLAEEFLDHIFLGQSYPLPSTIYTTVSTTNPGDDGSNLTEPSDLGDAGYSRVATSWQSSGSGTQYENNGAIAFAAATIDWGYINYIALMDDPSGGNMLFYGALNNPVDVDAGKAIQFTDGGVTLATD